MPAPEDYIRNKTDEITKSLIQNYQNKPLKGGIAHTIGKLNGDGTATLPDGSQVKIKERGTPGVYAHLYNMGNGEWLADCPSPVQIQTGGTTKKMFAVSLFVAVNNIEDPPPFVYPYYQAAVLLDVFSGQTYRIPTSWLVDGIPTNSPFSIFFGSRIWFSEDGRHLIIGCNNNRNYAGTGGNSPCFFRIIRNWFVDDTSNFVQTNEEFLDLSIPNINIYTPFPSPLPSGGDSTNLSTIIVVKTINDSLSVSGLFTSSCRFIQNLGISAARYTTYSKVVYIPDILNYPLVYSTVAELSSSADQEFLVPRLLPNVRALDLAVGPQVTNSSEVVYQILDIPDIYMRNSEFSIVQEENAHVSGTVYSNNIVRESLPSQNIPAIVYSQSNLQSYLQKNYPIISVVRQDGTLEYGINYNQFIEVPSDFVTALTYTNPPGFAATVLANEPALGLGSILDISYNGFNAQQTCGLREKNSSVYYTMGVPNTPRVEVGYIFGLAGYTNIAFLELSENETTSIFEVAKRYEYDLRDINPFPIYPLYDGPTYWIDVYQTALTCR